MASEAALYIPQICHISKYTEDLCKIILQLPNAWLAERGRERERERELTHVILQKAQVRPRGL